MIWPLAELAEKGVGSLQITCFCATGIDQNVRRFLVLGFAFWKFTHEAVSRQHRGKEGSHAAVSRKKPKEMGLVKSTLKYCLVVAGVYQ